MKKFISLSIALFCFTSFIESCESEKTPLATHAIYSETIQRLSFLPTTKKTEYVKITDLIGKNALVYISSGPTKVERNGLIDSEISTKRLDGILYSDGSIKQIYDTYHHSDKFVAQWPFKKDDLIVLGKISQ